MTFGRVALALASIILAVGSASADEPAKSAARPPRVERVGVDPTGAPIELKSKEKIPPGWADRLKIDPKAAVLVALGLVVGLGGGRKVLMAMKARQVARAIEGPDPDPADVEAAGEHGRGGLVELFRLLGTAGRPEVRDAAGRALARLWKLDELIGEEEKGIVRRGFVADWHARRRYPRGLAEPIPIAVGFGVPFLVDGPRAVGPGNLAWSYRIEGAQSARLEAWSEPVAGPGRAAFLLDPRDFASDGPHRLALVARVETLGLTDRWALELPHLPFSIEFDPNLRVDALLAMPDAGLEASFARSVRLVPAEADGDARRLVDLGADFVLRAPPELLVEGPLPRDLAHRLAFEFEGIEGPPWPAGSVVVAASNLDAAGAPGRLPLPIGPVAEIPPGAIDRPGRRKFRAHLVADPALGWTDPDVRSIWPGAIVTDWAEVEIIRR